MINRVAIIDDDTIFQFTTKITIERLKLAKEVVFFGDGSAVYDYITETAADDLPEVLLLDINMPITDGWDFLEMYKDLTDDKKNAMRIYMLSSSINPIDIEKAENNPHVLEYVIKPIADEILARILSTKKPAIQ